MVEQNEGNEVVKKFSRYKYPKLLKKQGNFTLEVGGVRRKIMGPNHLERTSVSYVPQMWRFRGQIHVGLSPKHTQPRFPRIPTPHHFHALTRACNALRVTLRSASPGLPFAYQAHRIIPSALLPCNTHGRLYTQVESGEFTDSEILVMLGENGTGKTTFIRMLAGALPSDPIDGEEEPEELPQFNVSYKPQKISPKFEGTVRQLLHKRIRESYIHPQVGWGVGGGAGGGWGGVTASREAR